MNKSTLLSTVDDNMVILNMKNNDQTIILFHCTQNWHKNYDHVYICTTQRDVARNASANLWLWHKFGPAFVLKSFHHEKNGGFDFVT